MTPAKVIQFLGGQGYDKLAEDLANFLGFTWGDKKMPKLLAFINEVLKENRKGDSLKASAQKWLDFLEETKRQEFLDYFEKNWLTKIDELWREESDEVKEIEEPDEVEETFEEREKRYLELMKEIVKFGPKKTEEIQPEEEKKKIISFEANEITPKKEMLVSWQSQKEEETELPEGTIIIKKKEEEQKIEKKEDLLDLSNL